MESCGVTRAVGIRLIVTPSFFSREKPSYRQLTRAENKLFIGGSTAIRGDLHHICQFF